MSRSEGGYYAVMTTARLLAVVVSAVIGGVVVPVLGVSPLAAQVGGSSAPTDLRVSASETRLSVTWSEPRDGSGGSGSGYRVELLTGGPIIVLVFAVDLPARSRSTNFGGLDPGTDYIVRVSVIDQGGPGAVAEVRARTRGVKPVDKSAKVEVVRAVRLFVGDERSGCAYSRLPCRWVDGWLQGFVSGRYRVDCYWSASRGSLGHRSASRTITVAGPSVGNLCWFNVRPGRYLTAVVDGVQSKTIGFDAAAPTNTKDGGYVYVPPSMADVDDGWASAPPPRQLAAPSAPGNLKMTAVDSGRDKDKIEDDLFVAWDPPIDDGGAPVTGYRVRLSRPPIEFGPDKRPGPWASSTAVTESPVEVRALACGSYVVRVAAVNQIGVGRYSRAEVQTKGCPLGAPEVELMVDGEPDLSDDLDVRIRWAPVAGADKYHLDWRYVETDTDGLRDLFSELASTVSRSDAESSYRLIDIALVGDEVSVGKAAGDSMPNSDRSTPEVLCHVDGSLNPNTDSRIPYCAHGSKSSKLDDEDPSFWIPSALEHHPLQVRVRAVANGDGTSVLLGDWSPWETVSTGPLDDACQPKVILGAVKDGGTAVEVGSWMHSSVRAVASIVSSSTGFPAETATRRALTRAAGEITRLALRQPGVDELLVAGVLGLARSSGGTTTGTGDEELVRLLIDCVGRGAGLVPSDIETLGEETLREYRRMSPELSDTDIESAAETLRTLMSVGRQ